MRLKEIEERLSAIKTEIDVEGADLDALETEIKNLTEERKSILDKVEKRKTLIESVVNLPQENVIKTFEERKGDKSMNDVLSVSSKEYRNAFLKNLVNADMTVEERAAFNHTTANTTAPLPATMLNQIWDLVSKKHVIMGDIKVFKTGTILEVVKHTAIVQGKAKTVAEGVANDDEQNTFVKVTLSGKDFSKHVTISYAMSAMSIDALEAYLISEIAVNLGEALADDTIATIKTGTATANKASTAGVKVVTYKELATLFGKLKNVSSLVVYVNNATFYNYLVSMEDTTGRPLFSHQCKLVLKVY